MLALAYLSQHAATGTLTLEAFQGALKRFVFLYTNLRHCFPPLRTSRLDNTVYTADGDRIFIITSCSAGVNREILFLTFSREILFLTFSRVGFFGFFLEYPPFKEEKEISEISGEKTQGKLEKLKAN
jgi:hypothetical protein